MLNSNFYIYILFLALFFLIHVKNNDNEVTIFCPEGYELLLRDEFDSFNSNHWSKGLTNDIDDQIRMIWNQHTGGRHLLNDNYAGYITDQNTFVENGQLILQNKKETIQGVDPVGTFEYTTGWINSLQKINFNGTQKVYTLILGVNFPWR
ncbi:MAG: hypothetical protein CM15mP65_06970 [Crocinitomicaceae bacterium]|nr:MAG: hypothetical protein CM15mP65_06970 [Crocinitomicaceae bacterium]